MCDYVYTDQTNDWSVDHQTVTMRGTHTHTHTHTQSKQYLSDWHDIYIGGIYSYQSSEFAILSIVVTILNSCTYISGNVITWVL